jgi:single-stranded-DNA-specific exonuclease
MLTKEKIKEILSKRIEEINSLQIPHFSLLDNIDIASKRIKRAIENGTYKIDIEITARAMAKALL